MLESPHALKLCPKDVAAILGSVFVRGFGGCENLIQVLLTDA